MRLLLIENSKTIVSLIQVQLAEMINVPVDWASTKEQAISLIETNGIENYCLAVSGLKIPGADDGSIVATITEYQIPTIIFSSNYSEELRNKFIQMPGVVDYVLKESQASLHYLCNTIYRLIVNRGIKALVVDDSRTMRMYVCELLRQHQFKVLEASSGEEALNILQENRDIKLVVTDFNMEGMNGFDLTKKIRETYDKDELAIIGLSGMDTATLSARFIKTGANDFLRKPFEPEEFFCRITQNMELIEKTKKLLDMATKDFLTGLYNRRFFFEKGSKKVTRLLAQKKPGYVAMLDIDHFKSVNDTYGHDVGDEVLRKISSILLQKIRPCDLVARMGGEEFCIIFEEADKDTAQNLLENMRRGIEECIIPSLQDRRHVTSSFGAVPIQTGEKLDLAVKRADELLYRSKQTGRNRLTIEEFN
ncbi:diguanylate cyclase [Terasakiella sp.]|uniref:diguanylate cyclase n=1 Tax=Terasakiella sp. TaxID=2034861 RepID=UPI003AA9499F